GITSSMETPSAMQPLLGKAQNTSLFLLRFEIGRAGAQARSANRKPWVFNYLDASCGVVRTIFLSGSLPESGRQPKKNGDRKDAGGLVVRVS
ncbi:MAG: hypothetical protein AB7O65_08415, partial [Candidatus Korobacteraceae bacterium]